MESVNSAPIGKRLAPDAGYADYLAAANALKNDPAFAELKPLKVAILRNFTVDPLLPVLTCEIASTGQKPEFYVGNYDTIAGDVLNPDSQLFAFDPDFIILANWFDNLSPAIAQRFLTLSGKEVAEITRQILAEFENYLQILAERTNATVLINNFPLPQFTTLGILDGQSGRNHTNTILLLNLELMEIVSRFSNAYLVDFMAISARIGGANVFDERYWHIAKAPVSRHALVPFGQEYGKFFRALSGKTRKCLVLDCDNTLWGGIVGEDGAKNIRIGTTFPGSCFRDFQQEILNLQQRGIILTICSKNNEKDVLDVLHNHPEMRIREEHLATWQINWDDKVTNIRRIATDLNIGLDSLVFIDDSPYECELVRSQLPEVAVLQVPKEPSQMRNVLSAAAFFDSLNFSGEDKQRTRMYRDQAQHNRMRTSANSLDDYLENLEMVADIGQADGLSIPRIAQLTQKTNQFNLTTKRYAEGDIRRFAESADSEVLFLRLRDRISDLGIIGAAIVTYNNLTAEIDTFLLSCRAIGRGAERALLAHIVENAWQKGAIRVRGKYIATAKNSQVANFYPENRFTAIESANSETIWELMPVDQQPKSAFIKINKITQEREHAI